MHKRKKIDLLRVRVLLLYFKSKGETKDISCETFARYGVKRVVRSKPETES